MSRNWTDEQKQVIAHRNGNLLVSAAAGSGKTAVLVERILSLVTGQMPEGVESSGGRGEPLDIDHILVLTFTNAAAGQMRDRIRDALEKKLEEDPENIHLQRQITLVHRASITTIDSFCSDVIRSHFQQIDLDPGFRIGEEGEMTLLSTDELNRMMEDEYARMEEPDTPAEEKERFADFVEAFSGRRSDKGVMEAISRFYQFSMAFPWPAQFRHDCLKAYQVHSTRELENSPWMEWLKRAAGRQIDACMDLLEKARQQCRMNAGPWKYEEVLCDDLRQLGALKASVSYDDYVQAADGIVWKRLPSYTKKEQQPDPDLKESVKNGRDEVKKKIGQLQAKFFGGTLEDQLALFEMARGTACELVRLTDLYEERFAAAKKDRNVIDFSDIEHMALKVLVKREDGQVKRTDAALEYARQFAEVMTDEYQDSNMVQEIILDSVSGGRDGRPNRFMVGDVKQSIYKFRMASPEIFMEKYHTYEETAFSSATEPGGAAPMAGAAQGHSLSETGRKIQLRRNFRSREEILSAVNGIFRRIMREDLGGVEYDDSAALYPGADDPPLLSGCAGGEVSDPSGQKKEAQETGSAEKADFSKEGERAGSGAVRSRAELWLVPEEDAAEPADSSSGQEEDRAQENSRAGQYTGPDTKARREAVLCARRIRAMVGKELIWDQDHYRTAGYGDVAVLLRSMKGWSETFSEVFARMGIPSYAGTSTGYFSAVEIQTVVSFLSVIDNPLQDIPLAASMRSPIGGFTDDELGRIRALAREGTFFDAVVSYDQDPERAEDATADKIRRFLLLVNRFREYAVCTPIHELIFLLLEQTGYGDYVLAMPAGRQRKANLDMLIEQAVAFEKGSYHGVFHFLRYMENLKKTDVDYGEAPVCADGGDCVRIMSIHKSKGLEFPIVFVCGLGKSFNLMDTTAPLLLHPQMGLGIQYLNRHTRLRCPVLLRTVLADAIRRDNLGEELRVLYVAMTRAQEKLILTGSTDDLRKSMDRWTAFSSGTSSALPESARAGAGSMLDWVMEALCAQPSLYVSDQAAAKELSRGGAMFSQEQVPGTDKETGAPWHLFFACPDQAHPLLSDAAGDALPGAAESLIAGGMSGPGKTEKEDPALTGFFDTDPDTVYDAELEKILLPVFEAGTAAPEPLIPARVSVSELKAPAYEAESEEMTFSMPWTRLSADPYAERAGGLTQPEGAQEPMTGERRRERMKRAADRGTSFHRIMEKLDFASFSGTSAGEAGAFLEFELERLIKCGKIHEDDLTRVHEYPTDVLTQFLVSPLGQRFCAAHRAGVLHRETPFVLGEEARRVKDTWDSSQMVMVQGIIDAWLTEQNTITLADYKTDSVYDDGTSLIRKYSVQLSFYRKALERLTGLPVKEVLIWSTALGRTVTVPV